MRFSKERSMGHAHFIHQVGQRAVHVAQTNDLALRFAETLERLVTD